MSGHRSYQTELGRWLSRDPIGERGGLNVHTMARNIPTVMVDVLGLWPGFITCTQKGQPKDSGWSLKTYIPEEMVKGTGGNISPAAKCIYVRSVITTYNCTCKCPKNTKEKDRTETYRKTEIVRGSFIWVSPGGAWPPLGVTDLVGDIIGGVINPPFPDKESARQITEKCKQKIPKADDFGNSKKDSGIPTRWCLWK